jgi:hypothetical protein
MGLRRRWRRKRSEHPIRMLIPSSGESHQQDELSPVSKTERERGISLRFDQSPRWERSFGAKARLRMTTKDVGLKPLRLPQGEPALRKAPGPLTNKKRERALGYKSDPPLKTKGGAPVKPKASSSRLPAKVTNRMSFRRLIRPNGSEGSLL